MLTLRDMQTTCMSAEIHWASGSHKACKYHWLGPRTVVQGWDSWAVGQVLSEADSPADKSIRLGTGLPNNKTSSWVSFPRLSSQKEEASGQLRMLMFYYVSSRSFAPLPLWSRLL